MRSSLPRILLTTALVAPAAGAQWARRNPPVHTGPRDSHNMAYDSESDRVLLYGGHARWPCTCNAETWVYDYATNTWTNMNPPGARPSERAEFGIAYDSESDRIILHGGETQAGPNDETWAYDFNSNRWMNMDPPAPRPGPRRWHRLAYDGESDRVILYGGDWQQNETWAYDFNSNRWTNMTTAARPPGLHLFAIAYDRESDRVVVFHVGRAWAYDFNANTWENKSATALPPLPGQAPAMAYDAANDRIVMQCDTSGGSDETWALDLNTNRWTNVSGAVRPRTHHHAMAYVSRQERIVMVGGEVGPTQADTWEYRWPGGEELIADGGFETGLVPSCAAGQLPATWFLVSGAPDTYSFDCPTRAGLLPASAGRFATLAAAAEGLRFAAAGSLPTAAFGNPLAAPLVRGRTYELRASFARSSAHPASGPYDLFASPDRQRVNAIFLGSVGRGAVAGTWTLGVLRFEAPLGAASLIVEPRAGRDSHVGSDSWSLVEVRPQPGFVAAGHGTPGTSGIPVLAGTGTLQGGAPTVLRVEDAAASAPGVLVLGSAATSLPIFGTVLVPRPDASLPVVASAVGVVSLSFLWPAGVPPGTRLHAQAGFLDSGSAFGVSITNALVALSR
jgi:hypothetical protein